jgi:hypothetical protein
MLRNKLQGILIVLTLCLVLGSQLVLPDASSASPDVSSASEDDSEVIYSYLPLVSGWFRSQYPSSFGVDLDQIKLQNGLIEMRQAGAYWLRHDGVTWSSVEPTKGARNWGALDVLEKELLRASKNDLKVILIVTGAPYWAQSIPGVACGPIKPTELEAFGSFMYDLVSRYSVAPYNVKYWEIWNEPDIPSAVVPQFLEPDSHYGCWGNVNDSRYYGGGAYAEMLKSIYGKIKQADPQSQVLVGGQMLDCNPNNPPANKDCSSAKFFEGILAYGGGNVFDGVSFHAYDYYFGSLGRYGNPNWSSNWQTTGPVVSAKVDYLNGLMSKYGVSGKYLMNTETALICGGMDDPAGLPPCDSYPTSQFEQTKAYYAAEVYAATQAKDVKAGIWYKSLGWRNSGLLYKDLNPRPAYYAYQTTRNTLVDSVFSNKITQFPGVFGYEFKRNGKLVWILWSADGASHTIGLPQKPSLVFDSMGRILPIDDSLQLQVELNPKFVEY